MHQGRYAPQLYEVMSDVEHSLGGSPEWEGIQTVLGLAAGSGANVLISGGDRRLRATLARLIHQESPRCDEPFVVADFRGATNCRPESLLHGSFFIEDVHDLTWSMQARLSSLLDHRARSPVSVRVMAGATQDLFGKMCSGSFSAGLFYRLNMIHLAV